MCIRDSINSMMLPYLSHLSDSLQNELAQIFLLEDLIEFALHKSRINGDTLFAQVRSFVAQVLDHALQNRVQSPGANVLGRSIHLERDVGQSFNAIGGELDLD